MTIALLRSILTCEYDMSHPAPDLVTPLGNRGDGREIFGHVAQLEKYVALNVVINTQL